MGFPEKLYPHMSKKFVNFLWSVKLSGFQVDFTMIYLEFPEILPHSFPLTTLVMFFLKFRHTTPWNSSEFLKYPPPSWNFHRYPLCRLLNLSGKVWYFQIKNQITQYTNYRGGFLQPEQSNNMLFFSLLMGALLC